MRRGSSGPRQPGGGRQTAGPRDRGGRAGKPFSGKSSEGKAFEGKPFRGKSSESKPFEGRGKRGGPSPRPGRAKPFAAAAPPREQLDWDDRPERKSRSRAVEYAAPSRGGNDRPPADTPADKRGDRRGEKRTDKRTAAPRPVPPPAPDAVLPTAVQTVRVSADEDGMRLDRFFEARFPGLSFSHIQRIIRKGEVRLDGRRAEPKDRVAKGQQIRVPPLQLEAPKPATPEAAADAKTRAFLKEITLYEDDDVMVLNKPMGLAVQGGSGMTRHVDGMLAVLQRRDGQRPRLVHRLDKDTAGCLLIAKTRFAAAALAKNFRSREARKIYWALIAGVPKPKQGRISTFLAKEEREDESVMRIARHGDEGASHAVTYYALVETAGQKVSWVSLKPVTGRTHQLRAHMAHIGHPIVGDPKYFSIENWELPGGLQNRLHLLARRIAIPHPRGGVIDVTAPLPPHMVQSWNLLGFDAGRYDPITDAPEE